MSICIAQQNQLFFCTCSFSTAVSKIWIIFSNKIGHFKSSAPQRSFSAIWHSRSNASTQRSKLVLDAVDWKAMSWHELLWQQQIHSHSINITLQTWVCKLRVICSACGYHFINDRYTKCNVFHTGTIMNFHRAALRVLRIKGSILH